MNTQFPISRRQPFDFGLHSPTRAPRGSWVRGRQHHWRWARWPLAASVGLAILVAGCGKVGDPLPPAPRLPLRTKNLAVTQQGPFLLLSFPNPNVKTLASLGFTLERIDVYRWQEPPASPEKVSEDEFADRATVIGSIDEQRIHATATGEEVVFRDGPIAQFKRAYRYAVRFISTRGQSAALSNIVSIRPSPKVARAPENVQVTDQAQDVVELTWEPVKSYIDGSNPVAVLGYNVYRRRQDQSRFDLPINGSRPVTATRYLDHSFQYNTEYIYTVRALTRTSQGDMIESADAEVAAHTPHDLFPPAAPADLTAGSADGVISLFWATNSEPDLAGYNIYRAEKADAPDSEWVRLNSTVHNRNTFRDENTVRGTTYYYKLTAIDRVGNVSSPSAIIAQEAQ